MLSSVIQIESLTRKCAPNLATTIDVRFPVASAWANTTRKPAKANGIDMDDNVRPTERKSSCVAINARIRTLATTFNTTLSQFGIASLYWRAGRAPAQ